MSASATASFLVVPPVLCLLLPLQDVAVNGAGMRNADDQTGDAIPAPAEDAVPDAVSEQTRWLIAVRDRRDRAAFSLLFGHFGPRIKAMLMRGGLRDGTAEDVVQDVMLAVWHKAGQFDPHRAEASAWVYRIARNRQIDLARRTRMPVAEAVADQAGTEPDGEQMLGIAQEVQALRAALRPGMTERDLAEVARAAFKAEGAVPEFTIIGAGANGAFPHHHTGETAIQPGDAIVCDIGGRKDGYYSDITRMMICGPAPEGYEAVHAVVDAAVQAALAAIRPGVTARSVDAAARAVIEAAGYGAYFTHRTGHGLGQEIHEPPYITGVSDVELAPGMVFTIEPGIYLPGRFGIRLEEVAVVTETGCEILSALPRAAFCA
ncbi:MAG TPA: M24 family metallopeptidase [Gemmobacter sp.]|nr:M24 family metallopeptidase [Gemmobacter sp.]